MDAIKSYLYISNELKSRYMTSLAITPMVEHTNVDIIFSLIINSRYNIDNCIWLTD